MNENIIAGGDIHAGDGGYSLGTKEDYDKFVKVRNQSLGKMRIKELMKEAGTDTSGKWMGVEHAEKFAELIVKECADIADTERSNSIGCGYITKTNGMRIKEHFGVEE
jgi:hypothetical protein